jgi:hypothetical protein
VFRNSCDVHLCRIAFKPRKGELAMQVPFNPLHALKHGEEATNAPPALREPTIGDVYQLVLSFEGRDSQLVSEICNAIARLGKQPASTPAPTGFKQAIPCQDDDADAWKKNHK